MKLPDLWDSCYEGEHRKMLSPEAFRAQFCDACMNAGCRNSKASRTSWGERMETQVERLLTSPNFADPSDPRFRELASMVFEDRLREALAIEVSSRKGDWEPVTEAEIGRAAAELLGLAPAPRPTGFEPSKPEPPKPEPPKPEFEKWVVRGDSKSLWTVSRKQEGGQETWECTCPSREKPCKHVRDIQGRLARLPEQPKAPPLPPSLPPNLDSAPLPVVPALGLNTRNPSEGILLGGGEVTAPASDPWAPPKQPQERVIPVGGRVTFGGGKKS
jgi:hypothetical protein